MQFLLGNKMFIKNALKVTFITNRLCWKGLSFHWQMILSLAEQPETSLYVKNVPAQSVLGQEAFPSALMKDGQETHLHLFSSNEWVMEI